MHAVVVLLNLNGRLKIAYNEMGVMIMTPMATIDILHSMISMKMMKLPSAFLEVSARVKGSREHFEVESSFVAER